MHHFTDSKQRIWQGINRGKIGETENGGNRHCFFLWCLPATLYSHQFIMFSFLYGPTKQTNGNQSDLRMLVLYICQAWRWFTGGLIIWVNYNLIVRFWQCTRHSFFQRFGDNLIVYSCPNRNCSHMVRWHLLCTENINLWLIGGKIVDFVVEFKTCWAQTHRDFVFFISSSGQIWHLVRVAVFLSWHALFDVSCVIRKAYV